MLGEMEVKAAVVSSLDPGLGTGTLSLDEDDGAVPVHFDMDACRGIVPEPGLRVLAGDLSPEPGSGGPLSDTFAMRARFVGAYRDADGGHIIPCVGIVEARIGKLWTGKRVLRVPYDESDFPRLATAFREDLLARLAFGPPVMAAPRPAPDYLQPMDNFRAVARRAFRFRIGDHLPIGGTFVGGDFADIGDTSWPSGSAGLLLPFLQIGVNDARRLGLDHQINVFIDPAAETEGIEPSLVPAFIRDQVHAAGGSPFRVVTSASGARVTGSGAIGDASPLDLVDEVEVFPSIIGLQVSYETVGEREPIDVTRFWEMELAIADDDEFRSIRPQIAKFFPSVDDIEGDVILGGFSSLHVHGGVVFKRLATFDVSCFEWAESYLDEGWSRVALEVCLDGPSPRAWVAGSS
jgi:hypothetical protein